MMNMAGMQQAYLILRGGCYAKAVDLSPEKEPEIYAASQRPGAILENVI